MRPNDTIIDEIDDAGRSSLEVDTSVVTAQGNETKRSILYQVWNILHRFFIQNQFIIMVLCAILLALAYPPLGADYLQPKITSTWIAVMLIFVLAGLGLRTEELTNAFLQIKFNIFVQCFNFGVVSSIAYGVSNVLLSLGAISEGLADGMVVCASLPLTINMVLVLTKSSGGDEAAAIFNAAFGNLIGVFLSPVLILGYNGVTGRIDLPTVFLKLSLRVVLPVLVGQILRKTSTSVTDFAKRHKKSLKKFQEYCLIFIIYTVFCRTFDSDDNSSVADIFVMITVQFFLLCFVMILAWVALKFLFPNEPKLRVMGLFGCTHKTVAMGVPLINAIYENNSLIGLYTLPLLIWHPMQLVIGSYLAPKLLAFVRNEHDRLGIKDVDNDEVEALPSMPVRTGLTSTLADNPNEENKESDKTI